jgi:hypothetical protein
MFKNIPFVWDESHNAYFFDQKRETLSSLAMKGFLI